MPPASKYPVFSLQFAHAMFKWIRRLHISLAAKCQLLFGAAVVLIIGAALFVPWQRMEQLTNQLNERSARTLTTYAIEDHVARATATPHPPPLAVAPQTPTSTQPAALVIPPTTAPVGGADEPITPPRLILFHPGQEEGRLTAFERRALRKLGERSDREYVDQFYATETGRKGYRFARADAGCVKCHTADHALPAGALGPPHLPPDKSPDSSQPASPATADATQIVGIVSVDIPSQIETSQLLLNRVFILTAGLLAGTLAIIVFYLITPRLILQPVRVLQETAEKVSEGDLNIRSDISTGDEFQQLSETFNTMLANLKQSDDQLRAVNKSLDIKLGQLAEHNVALYEANRLKSEFLANVSHELRTPLNSILGFADLLKEGSPEPKVARYVQNILSSGHNLLDLINDLLDLAKIEAGKMEIRSEPLSLNDLFEGLVSILKPLLEQKQLTIHASVSTDVPLIHTDPAKLQQVLYNFLSNAIKFSPHGEQIELRSDRESDDSVRVSVLDRGPGIPPDKQQVIFEKFRQADASHTRTHGGTGLGLAISKELIALLGGSIGVQSEPGRGATFWVVLPLQITAGTQDLRERLVLS
ncbi:MAG: ATP-binding protein [Tepidisphaeraceae bacterium]